MERGQLVEQVEFLLVTQGWAQVRTGDRRSEGVARTVLREAAKNVGVEVTTSKGDGFVRADSK